MMKSKLNSPSIFRSWGLFSPVFGLLPVQQAHSCPLHLQNSLAHHPQVRQRKHHQQLRGVLGQASVACLAVSKLALDDSKRMLNLGSLNDVLEHWFFANWQHRLWAVFSMWAQTSSLASCHDDHGIRTHQRHSDLVPEVQPNYFSLFVYYRNLLNFIRRHQHDDCITRQIGWDHQGVAVNDSCNWTIKPQPFK